MNKIQTQFAPMLCCKNVAAAMQFYELAFNAKELRLFNNDEGGVHVAELSINDAIFHLHEEGSHELSPQTLNGTSVTIGLFVDDVDGVYEQTVKAGATNVIPPKDYEYNLRQAYINDPEGHRWQIQKFIHQ